MRAGCDGGLNLDGFSRTRGLIDDADLLEFEAWRVRGGFGSDEDRWGADRRSERESWDEASRGSRKRGMLVMDMAEGGYVQRGGLTRVLTFLEVKVEGPRV